MGYLVGTNYYSVRRGIECVDQETFWTLRYAEGDHVMHIGKSSGGWCFSLHVIPEHGINDLWDWLEIFLDPDRVIVNEYREITQFSDMMRVITQRSRSDPNGWNEETMDKNYAEPGPNNLVRHKIGHGCVSHGIGTWDCITGYFS